MTREHHVIVDHHSMPAWSEPSRTVSSSDGTRHLSPGSCGQHSVWSEACEQGKCSTQKHIPGLETSSTPIVKRLRCSTERPLIPGRPVMAFLKAVSSINSSTCPSQHVTVSGCAGHVDYTGSGTSLQLSGKTPLVHPSGSEHGHIW